MFNIGWFEGTRRIASITYFGSPAAPGKAIGEVPFLSMVEIEGKSDTTVVSWETEDGRGWQIALTGNIGVDVVTALYRRYGGLTSGDIHFDLGAVPIPQVSSQERSM